MSDEEITKTLADHQENMDDWLILEKIEDVLVETSIPYNYDNVKFKQRILSDEMHPQR